MGLKEIKKELNTIDKSEIIKLISEMYKNIPSVKNYLDIYFTGEIEQLAIKYKKEIEKYVYPSGVNIILREAEARKLIRTVRKMKITELNIELELYYVKCCLEIIRDFGYADDNYYVNLEKIFNSAVEGINEIGAEEKYKQQLSSLSQQGEEYGLELYY